MTLFTFANRVDHVRRFCTIQTWNKGPVRAVVTLHTRLFNRAVAGTQYTKMRPKTLSNWAKKAKSGSSMVRGSLITRSHTCTRFGMETVEKMVEWTQEQVPTSRAPFIFDVGTGNGQMLFSLAEAGYDQKQMLGVDYSEDSIRLAKLVAESRGVTDISFAVADFLHGDFTKLSSMSSSEVAWDLVLDKGTFDAIALSAVDGDGRAPKDIYPSRAAQLLKPGALLLITCELRLTVKVRSHLLNTACNFTEEELKTAFAIPETGLVYQ